MSNKSLQQLYAEHTGKVSDKWQLYLTEYDRLLNDYREKPISLLEIGIQNGGSLEIWLKYFSQALMLIGCDINPLCARLSFDDPRICVIAGDANRPDVREQITLNTPQFDIIIDDGSHMSGDIIKTFTLYFPFLANGGVFIAEDMHCSYWERFEGGLFDPFSAITFFMRLADIINYDNWVNPKARGDILQGFFWKYNCKIDEDVLSQIHSVEFINSICVVRKASVDDNVLNRPVMSLTRMKEELADTKYGRLLDDYRDKPLRLLEIGIQNGGSLEMWSKYFNQALFLIGCGINPECAHLTFDDPRISMITGDANHLDVRERITRSTPQFDIIIDSGSHISSNIIKTFTSYFPVLANNGIFIVKDIHSSYLENFERALFDPLSAVTFFNHLIDIINYEHWGYPMVRSDILRSFFTKYDSDIDVEVLSQVHCVEFINSLCIVHKASAPDNVLGRRIISGTMELVTKGMSQAQESDICPLDQTFNPWTRLAWSEMELVKTKEELSNIKQLLAAVEQQLNKITSSSSWKMTLPLRQVGRWLTKSMSQAKRYWDEVTRLAKSLFSSR